MAVVSPKPNTYKIMIFYLHLLKLHFNLNGIIPKNYFLTASVSSTLTPLLGFFCLVVFFCCFCVSFLLDSPGSYYFFICSFSSKMAKGTAQKLYFLREKMRSRTEAVRGFFSVLLA